MLSLSYFDQTNTPWTETTDIQKNGMSVFACAKVGEDHRERICSGHLRRPYDIRKRVFLSLI